MRIYNSDTSRTLVVNTESLFENDVDNMWERFKFIMVDGMISIFLKVDQVGLEHTEIFSLLQHSYVL